MRAERKLLIHLATLTLLPLLCGLVPAARAQIDSTRASVTLIARLPESATVRWTVQPVPGIQSQRGLQSNLVTVQSMWVFGAGQTVRAVAQLEGDDQGASLIALDGPDLLRTAAIHGFLSTPSMRTVPLLADFLLRNSARVDTNHLLVTGSDSPTAERILCIRVMAF